jgi:transposase
VLLLRTIPGIGDVLGLTFAEIGDVARFGSPGKLIGYAGLARRSAGRATARGPVRCPRPARGRCAGPPSRPPTKPGDRPWHALYADIAQRAGKNPAKSAVARKVLIASWHVLSRQQPFTAPRPRTTHSTDASASSRCFLAA